MTIPELEARIANRNEELSRIIKRLEIAEIALCSDDEEVPDVQRAEALAKVADVHIKAIQFRDGFM